MEQSGITQVRKLLQTVRFATMATVNEDGSPHNSPFVFLHDAEFTRIYWGSHPESEHSKNILRTGKLFVVLFDPYEFGSGLYIQAQAGHIVDGEELEVTLTVHNSFRKRIGKNELPINYYTGTSPQRMWSATIVKMWINGTERDVHGARIKDARIEIKREYLVG